MLNIIVSEGCQEVRLTCFETWWECGGCLDWVMNDGDATFIGCLGLRRSKVEHRCIPTCIH